MSDAAIYFGEVMHRRYRPVGHRFVYRVFSILLDIDKLANIAATTRLFGYNRPRIFSFHDRDHGARDGSALRPWVEARLAESGMAKPARIDLLCFPRLFGFVFNPLSIYYCADAAGRLYAILYEVKNTFGGQHPYVLPVDPNRAADTPIIQHTDKNFYVSPFIDMTATYRFRLLPPGEKLSVAIIEHVPEGRQLIATQTGRRRAFTDAVLLRALFAYPLMTLKVVAGIHWQALRLWLKGATYFRQPPAPKKST